MHRTIATTQYWIKFTWITWMMARWPKQRHRKTFLSRALARARSLSLSLSRHCSFDWNKPFACLLSFLCGSGNDDDNDVYFCLFFPSPGSLFSQRRRHRHVCKFYFVTEWISFSHAWFQFHSVAVYIHIRSYDPNDMCCGVEWRRTNSSSFTNTRFSDTFIVGSFCDFYSFIVLWIQQRCSSVLLLPLLLLLFAAFSKCHSTSVTHKFSHN